MNTSAIYLYYLNFSNIEYDKCIHYILLMCQNDIRIQISGLSFNKLDNSVKSCTVLSNTLECMQIESIISIFEATVANECKLRA